MDRKQQTTGIATVAFGWGANGTVTILILACRIYRSLIFIGHSGRPRTTSFFITTNHYSLITNT